LYTPSIDAFWTSDSTVQVTTQVTIDITTQVTTSTFQIGEFEFATNTNTNTNINTNVNTNLNSNIGVVTETSNASPKTIGVRGTFNCNPGPFVSDVWVPSSPSISVPYLEYNGACVPSVEPCWTQPNVVGTQTWNGTGYDACVITACRLPGYQLSNNTCVAPP
jgi:hypothetical protein